jgi:ComF family protein
MPAPGNRLIFWDGWRQLLPLLFRQPCPLCRRLSAAEFCPDCWHQVLACQLETPISGEPGKPQIFGWGNYGGSLKQAIAALKYQNQPRLANPLGRVLAESWLRSALAAKIPLVVVPIPLHNSKRQSRGYNQAELIAASFCRITNFPLRQGLERIRNTSAQAVLSRADRLRNLQDAFRVEKNFQQNPPRHPVLLIDDIYTTGATAGSAILKLNQAGIIVYGIAAVAIAGKLGGLKRSSFNR